MGLEIPSEYGYVILTGTASIFVLAYKVNFDLIISSFIYLSKSFQILIFSIIFSEY